jgi:ankyrin repeat protein
MPNSKEITDWIQKGANDKLKASLEEDATIANGKTEHGVSYLQFAAYCRNKTAIDLIKTKKSTIDVFEAAAIGDVARISSAVEKEPALINSFSSDGFTPLGLACFFGQHLAASYLIGKGADVNQASNNAFKVAPLHSACAISDLELTRLLLKNGADANARQQQGVTALHEAAHHGKTELANLLVQHGADINSKMDNGNTPLFMAEEKDFKEMADWLRTKGGI